MKYVIIGRDGQDEEAPARRRAVRQQHLDEIQKNPHFVFGTAIMEDEQMVGSVIIMHFDNEDEIDNYLDNEIYISANVWLEIEVIPCADGMFGTNGVK